MKKQTILITGASSGIGKACADHLFETGHQVIGVSRGLQSHLNGRYATLCMDVNDELSVQEGVGDIVSYYNRIDTVINCAGIGIAGAVEDTTVEEAKAQFETNFFGVHRVCRAILPHMREHHAGLIINISSIAGMVSIPFQAFYCASKFAIEGYSEALRMEVAPFGIQVVSVQPGNFKSNFTENRVRVQASLSNTEYRKCFEKAVDVMERDEIQGESPMVVAGNVRHIIESRSSRFRHVVGPVVEKFSIVAKQWLPYSMYEMGMKKYFGVN